MRIKPHLIALVILNSVSLFFILQIEFSLLPLINCSLKVENVKNINEVIVTLSRGFILSSLFYLIVVFIPESNKRKSTMKLILPRLNTMANELHNSVQYLYSRRLASIHKPIEKLVFSDFEPITGIDKRRLDFCYSIKGSQGPWIPFSSGEQTELDHFKYERKLVTTKIDEIFALPTVIYLDDNLIEILANLRDSRFYSHIDFLDKFGPPTNAEDISLSVFEYFALFQRLKRYAKLYEFRLDE